MEWWKNLSLSGRFNMVMSAVLVLLLALFLISDYQRQKSLLMKLTVQNTRFLSGMLLEELHGAPAEVFPQMGLVTCYNPAELQRQMTRVSGSRLYGIRLVSLDSTKSVYTPDVIEAQRLSALKADKLQDSSTVVRIRSERSLLYLRPLTAQGKCLGCHGPFENVSERMREYFPQGSKVFDHKPDELMGALVISVPLRPLEGALWKNIWKEAVALFVGALILMAALNLLLKIQVLGPLRRLAGVEPRQAMPIANPADAPEFAPIYQAWQDSIKKAGPKEAGQGEWNEPSSGKEKGAA